MSKGAKIAIAVLIVAVIGLGAWWLTKDNGDDNSTEQSSSQNGSSSQGDSSTQNPSQGQTPNPDNVASTITYDGNAFTVSAATIKSGSTVKVVNNSQNEINFASDPHPVHTDNPELNQGDIEPGESKTFTLTTMGTWGFHNHYNPSQKGQIIVQ